MTEQYGPPIPVNGVRPEWLRGDEMVLAAAIPINARMIDWPRFSSIRMPITHPASICQRRALGHPDEALFYPVHADGMVPVDYDGGAVLACAPERFKGVSGFEEHDGSGIGYEPCPLIGRAALTQEQQP